MITYRLTVRGYELDSYGHVNNAVYLNYFEQARWEIMRTENLLEIFLQNRLLLVVAELKIRYAQEAKLFDPLLIQTRMFREGPYVIFKHKMVNEHTGAKIATAEVKTIVISEDRTPNNIPIEFDHLFENPQA
jgi:YbgC/YbaW family acyl-CoA thioester hydrolase